MACPSREISGGSDLLAENSCNSKISQKVFAVRSVKNWSKAVNLIPSTFHEMK